jgi:hypothetical protein
MFMQGSGSEWPDCQRGKVAKAPQKLAACRGFRKLPASLRNAPPSAAEAPVHIDGDTFEAGWFDCDANRHLKNTAFSNTRSRAGFATSMTADFQRTRLRSTI